MEAQRRRPRAVCSIGGIEPSSVSGVTITLQAGAWSVAEVRFHPRDAEGKATKVFSADVARTLGKLQELAFSQRDEPDAEIVIEDGQNPGVAFQGFTVSPSFSLIAGHIERKAMLVHKAALLDALKTGVYSWKGVWTDDRDPVVGTSWADRIKKATEFMIKYGRDDWGYLSLADREIMAQQHQQNMKLLPMWYELLDNSVTSTASTGLGVLTQNMAQAKLVNLGISTTLMSYLMASRDGFWNTINQLCSAFQLLYVPDASMGMGRLIRLRDVLAEPRQLQLGITDSGFRHSGGGIIPLQQVLVRSMGDPTFPPGDPTDRPQVIAAWPEQPNNTSGQVLETSMPQWLIPLNAVSPTQVVPVTTPTDVPGDEDPVDIDDYDQTVSTVLAKSRKAMDKSVKALLSEYARNLYCDRCLAPASFPLSVPLDTSLVPGDRYNVVSAEGRLFEGFLAQVTHNLEIAPGGGQGQAVTRLMFSHVELGDFKVPGR